jgi:hypothetical protein
MERSFINAVIGIVAIALFLSFLIMRPQDQNKSSFIDEVLTVNMPRPVKDFLLGFSLEGRKVIREIEDLSVNKKEKKIKKIAESKNGTKAAVETKKTSAEKKRDEARRREYLTKQAEIRNFRIRVVQESDRYRKELVRRELEKLSRESQQLEQYAGELQKQNQSAEKFEPEDQPEKEKLTADQWKSLVLSQPTQENILRMVEALKNDEIDSASYLEISSTLIRDNSEEKKKLGVMALTAHLSVENFSMAVKVQGTLTGSLQKAVQDYLFSYNRIQGIAILDQALKSQDTEVRTVAADMISRAVTAIQSGQPLFSTSTGRGSRGEASSSTTLNSYRRLLPTLQWLVSNPNLGLTQWAQRLLSQLQSSSTPA